MQHCKEEAEGPVTYLADVDEALVAEAAVLLAYVAMNLVHHLFIT